MAAALQGVRVVDLSQGIAGPLAARLLGDLGADVVKVEPPGGDPGRRLPPLLSDGPEDERSLLFAYLNWNKRGIVLDLHTGEDRRRLEALVSEADIVIESFPPGALDGWGLAAARMLECNPAVVVTSVTDFGQRGPYARHVASDLVLQAMSGIMQISGQADREPLKHGLNQAYLCGGLNAAYATLAMYCAARRDGIGDHVDLSVHECLTSELVTCETYYSFMGAIQGRRLAVQDPFSGAPIQTRRGYLSIQAGGAMPAETFADLLRNEALRDARFASNRERSKHVAEVRALVADSVRDRDAKAIFIDGSQRRLLMGVVQTAADLLACEHLAERAFFVEVDHPCGRRFRFPGELARLSRTPTTVRRRAPMLGEHTETVLAETVRSETASVKRPAAPPVGATPRLPLEGVRVLDMATVIAVPYLAALLSDLGADVIKIESPHRLDPTRQGVLTTYLDNDTRVDAINRSGMFQVVNRGKRSIAIDLSLPQGRQVLRELVAVSDIVVDNFTPRVMSGWGLDFDALQAINPTLIALSNTGYGATGPWRNFPSQGTTLEVTMGVAAYTGYRGDKPWKVGQSYPDFLACWAGLAALFAALHHVRTGGPGQKIDLGMYQVGVAMIPEALLQIQLDGTEPQRLGNEDALHVPSNVYRTAGDDRWVAITVERDGQWCSLAALISAAGIAVDAALSQATARRARREEVDALIARWVRDLDAGDLMRTLQAVGIACGPVMNNRDLLLDEHLRSRGFHERVKLPHPMGERPIMGRPWKLTHRAVRIRRPAPRYGADGRAILHDVLGMPADRIDALFDARVVCTAPLSDKPFDAMGLAELQRVKAIHQVDPDYRTRLGLGGDGEPG